MKNNNYFYLLFFLFVNLFFLHAKSNGEIGPNLNQIKPDIARVISTVTNGIGVMPPYKDLLSKEEIEAVAHYVSITAAE